MTARRIKILLDRGIKGTVDIRLAFVTDVDDLHDEELLSALRAATELMESRLAASQTLPMPTAEPARQAA